MSALQTVFNKTLFKLGYQIKRVQSLADRLPKDFDAEFTPIYEKAQPYSMTSPERLFAIYRATRYIEQAKIGGSFAECGVWRGGSSMAMALSLMQFKDFNRDLYLFDTYAGMTEPTAKDQDLHGKDADTVFVAKQKSDHNDWCYASIEDVQANLKSTNYPADKLHFIKGPVEQTLTNESAPDQLALLRLDTDWYESTYHELNILYPKLQPGGVLIIDDYGHWEGARKAVDQYFAENNIAILLNRIDYTARMAIKP